MDKLFNSNLSIEKMAAYLDGNLPEEEMQEVSSIIDNDSYLQAFIDKSDYIDDQLLLDDFDDSQLPEELLSSDFEIPDTEKISISDDIFSEDTSLYSKEPMNNSNMEEKYDDLSDHSIFGENGTNDGTEYSPYIQQSYDNTCVIRSQQIVMRDYGVDISENDLRDIAEEKGWYSEEGGTPISHVGDLLEMAGIECHQSEDNTVYDLVCELSQGHRVIVGVDSGELWAKTFKEKALEKMEDLFEQSGPDHALIVAGIDVNPHDPKDIKVVLTDPGSGDLRKEYDMNKFVDAWKDGKCFMVSTEEPAPYQFDPSTGREVPSGFQTNYLPNSFVEENGYKLSPDDLTIPDDYLASYSENNGIDWNPQELTDGTEDLIAQDESTHTDGIEDIELFEDID